MLAITYRFEVRPGQEDAFVATWTELTRATDALEGARGSRLHRDVHHPGVFWGYAQWKDAATRDRALSNTNLSPELNQLREAMQLLLQDIAIVFEAEVEADLLNEGE